MAAFPLFRIPTFLEAVVLLGLAGWLIVLAPRNRLNRAFALLLFLRGTVVLLGAFYPWAGEYPLRVAFYLIVAIPFAALYFGFLYLRAAGQTRWTGSAWARWAVPALLLSVTLLLEIAYVLDHRSFIYEGTFATFSEAEPLANALVGLLFAWEYGRLPAGVRRTSVLLVGLGFLLSPLYTGAFFLTITLGNLPIATGSLAAEFVAWIITFAIAAGAALLLAAPIFRPSDPLARREATRALAVAPVPVVLGILVGLHNNLSLRGVVRVIPSYWLYVGVDAIWTILLGGLVVYALVRHRLFDIDARIRVAISGGTVAGLVVATFFVLTEVSQVVLEEMFSGNPGLRDMAPWLGILGAGLLLIAAAPLQRLGQRLAVAAIPEGKPMARMNRTERTAFFRDRADLAWLDGIADRQERVVLDRLRERLGIDEGLAHDIERSLMALARAPGVSGRQHRDRAEGAPRSRSPPDVLDR